MSEYESIIRDGKTFIDIQAANDLRKELNDVRVIATCAKALDRSNLRRIAELEEQLSVWRSVFPALAPRLFPENGDE